MIYDNFREVPDFIMCRPMDKHSSASYYWMTKSDWYFTQLYFIEWHTPWETRKLRKCEKNAKVKSKKSEK